MKNEIQIFFEYYYYYYYLIFWAQLDPFFFFDGIKDLVVALAFVALKNFNPKGFYGKF
jgi:hypothetical protein